MKRLASQFAILLLAAAIGVSAQQPQITDTCKFEVAQSTAKPTITGPDEIVKLVHVVEQLDSPLEILAVDFEQGSWLTVANEQVSSRIRGTVRVRNRSDRNVLDARVILHVASAGSSGGGGGGLQNSLPPGQEAVIKLGSNASGSARNNYIRLVVDVETVDFGTCMYYVSKRVPKELGIWLPH